MWLLYQRHKDNSNHPNMHPPLPGQPHHQLHPAYGSTMTSPWSHPRISPRLVVIPSLYHCSISWGGLISMLKAKGNSMLQKFWCGVTQFGSPKPHTSHHSDDYLIGLSQLYQSGLVILQWCHHTSCWPLPARSTQEWCCKCAVFWPPEQCWCFFPQHNEQATQINPVSIVQLVALYYLLQGATSI